MPSFSDRFAHVGDDQPVILQLLDITPAMDALGGVKMELDDCAFPLLADVICTDDPEVAFKDTDYALLVGARPRGPGMERKDLLEANAAIFGVQGKAINTVASRDIKVLVVGNPANTNALITQRNAPDIDPRQFTAMTRLDHNRAKTQLAERTNTTVNDIRNMTIWGNHSATSTRTFITLSYLEPLQWKASIWTGTAIPLSRPSNNAVPRLLRQEALPLRRPQPTRPSITCVAGR